MAGNWLRHMLFSLVIYYYIQATEGAPRCPRGSAACGPGCLPEGAAACIADNCYDAEGLQVLCDADSRICGGSVCPLWSFCDQVHQKCIPDTCSFRRTAWCQETNADRLERVQCMGQAVSTECFASSSGNFSCHQHTGWVVAKCQGALAVGMAAIPLQSDAKGIGPGTRFSRRQLKSVACIDQSGSSRSGRRLYGGWNLFSSRCRDADTISESGTAHAQHRLLLQLFLPGLDSSSFNYLFPSGGSSSSYGVRYSSPGQQHATTSSNWQQSALDTTGSQLVSSQYGQPSASARFFPVVNPAGSITQPGMIERHLQPLTLAVPQILTCLNKLFKHCVAVHRLTIGGKRKCRQWVYLLASSYP